ncbi:MAG TPA: WYL domain-containing protein, partial [Gemmatimonas sp.]|nr:WYL domain-containing protein [Gemmatimonas sp.]
LGLSMLRGRRTPDEHDTIDRAQEKLREIVARLPDEPIPEMPYAVAPGYVGDEAMLEAIAGGLHDRQKVRIVYRKSGGTEADSRVVRPYQLQLSNGMLYLLAYCDRESGVRHFRFDRIEEAYRIDEPFERPADFSAAQVMEDGRVFHRAGAACMRVHYSPAIARWIAEREGRTVASDGSLVMEHPLADGEWALRHLMQYGGDAEVLEPQEAREAMLERLQEMERALALEISVR